jgi:hypothetical protein
MARQTGDIIITGTIDDIIFYIMDGKGYARKKSSLKGTRVKKDPRFKRTMQSAQRLARGAQLASKVYRSLPREEQVYGLFRELKSMAILALKEGKSEEEVVTLLQQRVGKETDWEDPRHGRVEQSNSTRQKRAPAVSGSQRMPVLFQTYGEQQGKIR